jgi:hypothetical protein
MMTSLGFLAAVVWKPHRAGKPGSLSIPVSNRSCHTSSEKVQIKGKELLANRENQSSGYDEDEKMTVW